MTAESKATTPPAAPVSTKWNIVPEAVKLAKEYHGLEAACTTLSHEDGVVQRHPYVKTPARSAALVLASSYWSFAQNMTLPEEHVLAYELV